jgi:hypothetical protein
MDETTFLDANWNAWAEFNAKSALYDVEGFKKGATRQPHPTHYARAREAAPSVPRHPDLQSAGRA